MHRFFITDVSLMNGLATGATVVLPEKVAHQVHDVLRLAVGEQLILLDNSGDEILCEVAKTGRTDVEVIVIERHRGKSESSVRIILYQGLLKSARFEWILEKGTELGVSVFVPTVCRRSMAGLEEAGATKLQRWQRILQEATEQCGNARVPTLQPIRSLTHALKDIPKDTLAVMAWEEEHVHSLRDVLTSFSGVQSIRLDSAIPMTVALFIGPEGGLMEEEVKLAQRQGVQVVSLGARILRAETAALAAVANILMRTIQTVTVQDGTDIVLDIVTLVNAINDHTFRDRDDLWCHFVQHADDGTLIAAICVRVGHEREQFIG